jgi:hypothetical protein
MIATINTNDPALCKRINLDKVNSKKKAHATVKED